MRVKTRVLIVDDQKSVCETLQFHLEGKGYNVSFVTSAKEALVLIKENPPEVLLLDKRMPDVSGIYLLTEIRKFNPDIKVIMMSADDLDAKTEEELRELNIIGYLHKPMDLRDLEAMVEIARRELSQ